MSTEPKLPSRRIADLNDDDRPREKAIAKGIRALSDAELLAILIGGGVPGKSAIDLAREILDSCNKSINELSQLSIADMSRKFAGIGPAKATTIAAAIELGSRRSTSGAKISRIRTSADAYSYIKQYVENLPTEEFWAMFLKRDNRVRMAERISSGGTAATYVEPKLVVKKALDYLAAGVILVHNHPSGNLNPSVQDDALTRRIKEACKLLDINVLDHLIVTASGFYSYADEGRL